MSDTLGRILFSELWNNVFCWLLVLGAPLPPPPPPGPYFISKVRIASFTLKEVGGWGRSLRAAVMFKGLDSKVTGRRNRSRGNVVHCLANTKFVSFCRCDLRHKPQITLKLLKRQSLL